MRILATISLIFTFATFPAPSGAGLDVDNLNLATESGTTTESTTIANPVELVEFIPGDAQLISVKIRNEQQEVIAKWLEKGIFVTPKATKFLQKASSGKYNIQVLLIDGTEKTFLYNKG
ncbi:MAG: hypothetical protein AAFO69_06080 [Bacteroidota bacterium]